MFLASRKELTLNIGNNSKEGSITTQILIKIFLVLILLFPYLIVFFGNLNHFESLTLPHFPLIVFYKNFVQAFWSALICLFIGIFGALGLIRYRSKTFLEMFILIPSFFPALFVIFSLLTTSSLLPFDFPYGLSGIVIAHVVIYSGLVSTMLARAFKESCGSQIILARVFGHSQKIFFFICYFQASKETCLQFF